MTLAVFVDDPAALPDDIGRKFIKPAGFENYRRQLWGTESIRRRAALLAEIATDLHLSPNQFDEFARQCTLVAANAAEIAAELGWSDNGRSIQEYVRNFLEAVEFARIHGSPEIYIG